MQFEEDADRHKERDGCCYGDDWVYKRLKTAWGIEVERCVFTLHSLLVGSMSTFCQGLSDCFALKYCRTLASKIALMAGTYHRKVP